MSKTQALFSLAMTALALPLTNCGGGGARHDVLETYYLVATNTKIPYWQAAGAGLAAAGDQMKVRYEMVGPESYDPQGQKEAFEKVVRQRKPSGILVSPAAPELMKADIDAAVSQGIPVITIDSDSPGSKRLFFIGTNNYDAGRMGGELAAKSLGGKGSVIVFTMPEQANLKERLAGYEQVFRAHPGIKIAEVIDIKGNPTIAFDRTMEILEKGKPVADAFICLEALACPEVAEVLSRRNVKGKLVVAMDTDPRTLEWIQKGLIAATIAQKPFTMSYFGLKVLDDLFHYKLPSLTADFARDPRAPLPAFIDTGATLIDKSNVEKFLKTGS